MPRAEPGVDRLSAKVPVLERRIDHLESLVIRALVAATVTLLGVGSVLTVAINPGDDIGQWSLLSAPVRVYGTLMTSDNVPYTLAVMVGAGLFLAVVLIAMLLCLSMVRREGSKRTLGVANGVAAVLLVGACILLILAVLAGGAEHRRAAIGPALWWFVPGVALFGLLVRTESLRRLWYAGD